MKDNKEEEKKVFTKEEILKLSIIIVVFILLLVYSIFTGNNKKNNNSKDNVNIAELMSPITNNYTLKIDKISDGKHEKIEFITDGELKLYNKENDKNGYLIYKNKIYYVQSEKTKITEIKDKPKYIDDNFTNIDFIKTIIEYCDIQNIKTNSLECNINIKDYIENYNVFFNTSYKYDGEDIITFKFTYYYIISEINVDYTKVNEIINEKKNLEYNIKIDKVNSNDYSNLLNVFEKTLK